MTEQAQAGTEVYELVSQLSDNMQSVVLGKPEVIRLCMVALLAGEHILLEDVPGVGKTLIGKTMARSVNGKFCRIQFTPDLLPGDITGTSVYRQTTGDFEFIKGPIFANVVLADEINRTTPRTQSALLEAMSDGQVSIDSDTYNLPQPFIVIATQNPFEFDVTYPLPESQLDRFLIRIAVGYPNREDEMQVLDDHRVGEPVDDLQPVLNCQQIRTMQEAVREVTVSDAIRHYLLDLVDITRHSEELHVGVSTRGALCLYRAAQALATVEGRDYVVPDDVKELTLPVLCHRMFTKGYVHSGHREATESILRRILDQVPVPK
ncbi:MAG: MoxR family ATPase [Planctomycetales bacterium]